MECLTVHRMHHHGDPGGSGGKAADDPRFGGMGVNNIKLLFPEKFFQPEIRTKIVDRIQFPHQIRKDLQPEPGSLHHIQQDPFTPRGMPRHQRDIMPGSGVIHHREQRIFLGTAHDHAGDDVANLPFFLRIHDISSDKFC